MFSIFYKKNKKIPFYFVLRVLNRKMWDIHQYPRLSPSKEYHPRSCSGRGRQQPEFPTWSASDELLLLLPVHT